VLGIVVGLVAEGRLANGLAGEVEAGGGTADGAAAAARRLVARGAKTLLSFGLAGGLDPGLQAGAVLVPLEVVDGHGQIWQTDPSLARRFGTPAGSILASDRILATVADKRTAWEQSAALAVDIESGAVAEIAAAHGLPFAVLRAVCDPAGRNLPVAALTALDQQGRIQPGALLRSLARDPRQIPALITLGREAAKARKALLERVNIIRFS
jgi:adenosylhomocysteine nucleosidase